MFELLIAAGVIAAIYYATSEGKTAVQKPEPGKPPIQIDPALGFQYIVLDDKTTEPLDHLLNSYWVMITKYLPEGPMALESQRAPLGDLGKKLLADRVDEIDRDMDLVDDPMLFIMDVKDFDAVQAGMYPSKLTVYVASTSKALKFCAKGRPYVALVDETP